MARNYIDNKFSLLLIEDSCYNFIWPIAEICLKNVTDIKLHMYNNKIEDMNKMYKKKN